MRRLLVALALIGFVSDAVAGEFEMPTLRGSSAYEEAPFVVGTPSYTRWSGFYAGAEIGYGSAHVDFSKATQSLIAFQLRELALESQQHPSTWQILGQKDTASTSYGGFAGYNSQWDDVILGVELNYSAANFFATAPNSPITRVTSAGGNTYLVQITGAGTMNITDYGTARARAGYIMKNFMPYAFVGLAVGRADITRSATVSGTETAGNTVTPFSFTGSETKNGAWLTGWAAGGGLEVLMMPNVFLRGEYEYASFAGVSGIKASVSTVRIGAGLKY
jgi:opacity protein-like surface antigen